MSPLVVVVIMRKSGCHHAVVQECSRPGAVAFAGHDGCLVVTSRHVVDALARSAQIGSRVGVTLQDGQQADATVVGLHRSLDLALIWVARDAAQTDFAQPLRGFKTVVVGEQVFVIGHPEGLSSRFPGTGGADARRGGDRHWHRKSWLGGVLYDVHGRLMLSSERFDKTRPQCREPELRGACRRPAESMWTLSKDGRGNCCSQRR